MNRRTLGILLTLLLASVNSLHAQQTATTATANNEGQPLPSSVAAPPAVGSTDNPAVTAERPIAAAPFMRVPVPPPGVTNFIPIWTTAAAQGDSVIFQEPATNNIGVNTTTPAGPLDVLGLGAGRHDFRFGSAAASDNNEVIVHNNNGTRFSATFVQGQSFFPIGSIVVGAFEGDGGLAVSPESKILFGDAKVQRMVLSPQGRVGIGFGDPQSPLDVRGPGTGLTGILNVTQTNDVFGVGISVNGDGGGSGINVTNTMNGIAGHGRFFGLIGFGGANGAGVFGENDTDINFTTAVIGLETGPTATNTSGVAGAAQSPLGIGVIGRAVGPSTLAGTGFHGPAGIWGDSSAVAAGVLATVDNGIALNGFNNSTTFPTLNLVNTTASAATSSLVLLTRSGASGPGCAIDVLGNLRCIGSKSSVVPIEGGNRKVALYAVEAAENWFEDAGSAKLSNGSVVVGLDQAFSETVSTDTDYHVFLAPLGDCKGLYVAEKNAKSFIIRELGGGHSDVSFDYRLMARRKGYEAARLEDMTQLDEIAARAAALNGPVKGIAGGAALIPRPPGVNEK
jgi:hypothetical protein